MIALPFFIPAVCMQKDRLFIKTPVSTVYGSGPVFQKTGFSSKLRLYLIWKWTGLSKDRLFIKTPVSTQYGSGPVFQKTGFFIKTPVSTQYGSGPVFQKIQLFIKNPGF